MQTVHLALESICEIQTMSQLLVSNSDYLEDCIYQWDWHWWNSDKAAPVFCGLVGVFLATLQSHLGGSGSPMSSRFFKIYARGVQQHRSGRAKATQNGTMNSNWCYFAPAPWSSQECKKSRRALGCHHLPSFHRFTLSCDVPYESWLTVNSAMTCGKKKLPQICAFFFSATGVEKNSHQIYTFFFSASASSLS